MGGSLTGLHVQALLAIDEWKYQGDGLLGLLLHDPMAGIAYHGAAHVDCGKRNFCRKAGAIGMITTNGQDRHRQLALGKEFLVVDRILGECGELSAECVMDGAGASIKCGVMIASLLVDAGGICRKFIVEAVEQNALPAGYKALHIRTAEVEVPNLWDFQLVVPMTDAGETSDHPDPFRHTLGIECRKGIAYHIANVVSDEGDFLDSHLIEDCSHVPSLGGLFVTAFGMGGQAHTTEIRDDDSVVFDQWFGERYPHISRVAEAMQQEHRRALTIDPNILGASADRHLPGAKGVRPYADRRVGRRRPGCKHRCEGRQRCGAQWMQ